MALRPRGNRGRPEPRRDITPINDRIRVPQVRVISESNDQLGVMDTRDAVSLAREKGYDLILVAPQAQPPVCRIMDYGKYKYEKSKKEKKVKSAANEMKMVRLHPRTGRHDRDILVRHTERFLREGHKVRVVCQFKGRENAYPEIGRQQLDAIAGDLAEISAVEGMIGKQGRDMTMMLTPKPGLKPLPKVPKDNLKGKAPEPSAVNAEPEDEDEAFEALQQRIVEESGPDDEDPDDDTGAEEEVEEEDDADAAVKAAIALGEQETPAP